MPLNWAYKVYPYPRTKHNLTSPSSMYYGNVMPLFTYWRSSSLTVLFHWSCKYNLIVEVLNILVCIYYKPRIIEPPQFLGSSLGVEKCIYNSEGKTHMERLDTCVVE